MLTFGVKRPTRYGAIIPDTVPNVFAIPIKVSCYYGLNNMGKIIDMF